MLAILAGIVGSDGHLEKKQPVVRIINSDEKFIKEVVVPLVRDLILKNPTVKEEISGFGKKKMVVVFTSRELWTTFQEKFNIPVGSKSERIKPPNSLLNEKEKLEFLAGWIAGDGSITNDRGRPKIEIWSKSFDILNWFSKLLIEKGISSRIWKTKRNIFVLRIGKIRDVITFSRVIKIPHPSKQEKLNKLLSLCS